MCKRFSLEMLAMMNNSLKPTSSLSARRVTLSPDAFEEKPDVSEAAVYDVHVEDRDGDSSDSDLDPVQRQWLSQELSQTEVDFDAMLNEMTRNAELTREANQGHANISKEHMQREQNHGHVEEGIHLDDEFVQYWERLDPTTAHPQPQQLLESHQPEPKRLKQMTLTQTLPVEPNNCFPKTPKLKDTEDCNYLGGTLYKRGETWMSPNSEALAGYFFTIANFKRNSIKHKLRKEAVCGGEGHVHVLLSKTFIGPEESERLAKTWAEITDKQDPDKAQCVNTWRLLEKGCIPLQALTKQLTGPTPKSDLLYEVGLKESFGVGYTCAYRYKRDLSLPLLPRKQPIALDLFAGGGGTSIGFAMEGFDVRYKVEIDPAALATFLINSPNSHIFPEHVEYFLKQCQAHNFYPQPGDIDHICASPPCQGFSRANRGPGGMNDEPNNRLTQAFVDAVEFFQPRTAMMENVMGILDAGKGKNKKNEGKEKDAKNENNKRKHLLRVMADLLLLQNQIRLCIVKASDYGDPQDRERVILFAAKKGYKLPDFPKPTHGDERELRPRVSVKDVLGDLENVEPVLESGLVQLPDGTLIWDHNKEGTDLKSDEKDMCRLVEDLPAKTVRKANAMKHYSKPRYLTIRERARLQSFPDDYKLAGRLSEKNDQIGNAVPVNLARAVARSIMASLKDE